MPARVSCVRTLQLAVVVGAGAALARAFNLREPRVTHAYWRTLLVVGLLLPFVQPWTQTPPSALAVVTESPLAIAAEPAAAITIEPTPHFPLTPTLAALLAGGIALRTLWLFVGAWTLRRLRRQSSPLVPTPLVHGVVDFIDLQWFPIFNVADMGVTIGGIMLLLAAVLESKPASR